jgi:hypothetical protein
VIEAGIVMVNTAQHDDADPVFAFELIERLSRLPANLVLTLVQRFEADGDRPLILFAGGAEDIHFFWNDDVYSIANVPYFNNPDLLVRKRIGQNTNAGARKIATETNNVQSYRRCEVRVKY